MCDRSAIPDVVPANAGTHTWWSFDLAKRLTLHTQKSTSEYGSLHAQGRLGFCALGLGALALAFAYSPAHAGDDALVTYKSLTPEVALEAAQTAMTKCRADGFQVAVVVVDRFGQPQVLLRDRYAGLPAADIATAKAYTALSFRRDTSELAKMVRDGQMDANLARMPHIAMLAGALVIEAGGTLLGGIGVSGAPGGDKDEACAKAGLDSIRDKLDF